MTESVLFAKVAATIVVDMPTEGCSDLEDPKFSNNVGIANQRLRLEPSQLGSMLGKQFAVPNVHARRSQCDLCEVRKS